MSRCDSDLNCELTIAVPVAVVVLVVFPPHVGPAHHAGPQAALGSLGEVQQGGQESGQQRRSLTA